MYITNNFKSEFQDSARQSELRASERASFQRIESARSIKSQTRRKVELNRDMEHIVSHGNSE